MPKSLPRRGAPKCCERRVRLQRAADGTHLRLVGAAGRIRTVAHDKRHGAVATEQLRDRPDLVRREVQGRG